MSSVKLIQNSYGKSDVRLTKVIRNGPRHELLEFSVDVELHGDFAESYTAGDNSNVVATDSMKNTVYVIAKENSFASAEAFALLLATHFVKTYAQVLSANVVVRQVNWQRIDVAGEPHDHAFVSGGSDLIEAHAVVGNGGSTVRLRGGIRDLLVAKTTRSSFENFVTDRYRTLADAADRIFGTSVSATWHFDEAAVQGADYSAIAQQVRLIILEVFAGHMSRAVQETMYAMAEEILAKVAAIQQIDFRLPNKHRIPFNLKPFGLENSNEIFVWTDEPYGDIRCSVTRSDMPGKLTTHVLDTANGKPAASLRIDLHRLLGGGNKQLIVSAVTNADGRLDAPLLSPSDIEAGRYRLLFHVGDYFASLGSKDAKRFLDVVPVLFIIDDAETNYHVPLLISPWSYSTYRGS